MRHFLLLTAAATVMLSACPAPAAEPETPPAITQLKVRPNPEVFKAAKRNKPLELRSAEDAGKYFSDKALAKLEGDVDFDQQFVLVFAWRGSGQDKLTYAVAESFPEQIKFTIKPGRTRDLRPHVHVFALRNNVKWSVGK